MSVVVYVAQMLLFIPCFWLMTPVPRWLEKEFHWQSWMAIGVAIVITCLLWIVVVVLTTFILGAVRRRWNY